MALLSRDREPDPFEGLESHHMAVAASAGAQRTFWTAVGGRQDQPSIAFPGKERDPANKSVVAV